MTSTTQAIKYSPAIETEIEQLAAAIGQTPALAQTYPPRWLAIQLLEQDGSLLAEVRALNGAANLIPALNDSLARLKAVYNEDIEIVLADQRYAFVNRVARAALVRPEAAPANMSDRIDRIVTHRWLGIPIFLSLMWVVFKITTDMATPYIDWVDNTINGPITQAAVALLALAGLGGTWFESLLVNGIIAGVGGVMVFVPALMSLYVALAILEDSGYMARAAFVMDRVMQRIGLHGKSFLPMVVGFGCSVPGLYATRTLENERDRILTGLLVPFMSCGARLPVYVLFATIFFPQNIGVVIFSLYLTGIAVAVGLGFILKNTLFNTGEETAFLIEMPPYRRPNLKTVWFYVWERTSAFIKNAWSLILITSMVIWLLMALPVNNRGQFANVNIQDSAFGLVSGMLAPVFAPLGFGSWESSGALLAGFVAKEVVVSTTSQIYNVQAETSATNSATLGQSVAGMFTGFAQATLNTFKSIPLLVGVNLFENNSTAVASIELMAAVQARFQATSGGHGALAALAFMVFVLLYTPCMATIAAIRHELGPKWMWVSIFGQFAVAWLAALIVFQGGRLLLAILGAAI